MDWIFSTILSVVLLAAMMGVFALIDRLFRSRGRADRVQQMVAIDSDAGVFWLVEAVSGVGETAGRISLRSSRDGSLVARVDADEDLRVLATDEFGNLVCSDPHTALAVRDAHSLAITRDAASIEADVRDFADRFAPADELRPEFDKGALSVLDRTGKRVSLAASLGTLKPIDEFVRDRFRSASHSWSMEGHPRARLRCDGKNVGDLDFLEGELLGVGVDDDALVLSRVDLRSQWSELHRVTPSGEIAFTVALGRSARGEIEGAFVQGERLVLLVDDEEPWPLELLGIDTVGGTIAWRLRP